MDGARRSDGVPYKSCRSDMVIGLEPQLQALLRLYTVHGNPTEAEHATPSTVSTQATRLWRPPGSLLLAAVPSPEPSPVGRLGR